MFRFTPHRTLRLAAPAVIGALLWSLSVPAHAQSFDSVGRFPGQSGEAIYKGICQGCHMPDGKGASGAGAYPALASNEKLAVAAFPITLIVNGRKAMPAFGDALDDQQVANVVNYIRTNFGNSYTDEPATPAEVAEARPTQETKESSMKAPQAVRSCRLSLFTLCLAAAPAAAAEIVHTPMANPNVPIAASVTVPPGYTTYYISGALADPADPKAAEGSVERMGNTETQTRSVLAKLKGSLDQLGLGFGDVVQAHVYLAADPATGKMDFAGLNKAWSEQFGSPGQPNKPARATVQVAALVAPGALVEIEFTAAKKVP